MNINSNSNKVYIKSLAFRTKIDLDVVIASNPEGNEAHNRCLT